MAKSKSRLIQPHFWENARIDLIKQDPILGKVIANYRGEFLNSRGNAFQTLARSIVGQQISVKAAESIWKKFVLEVKTVKPENILKKTTQKLRACGLSERKVIYLKDLSDHFIKGKIKPNGWAKVADEDVIEQLIAVKGIGRWTAEMFLIFHLLRPDVFPVADLGLQKAISKLYSLKYPLSERHLKKFRAQFSPWASVATWYLWRSLDPIAVEY